MNPHAVSEVSSILLFAVGFACALLASALVPPSRYRQGAAIAALLGLGFAMTMIGRPGTPLRYGLAAGILVATIKLATGLRFL